MKFRPIEWSRDHTALRNLDASLVSDRVYAVRRTTMAVSLIEKVCSPPLTERYEMALTKKAVATAAFTVVAHENTALAGFAAVRQLTGNRRAVITDFFVAPRFRRRGLGTKMMKQLCRHVAATNARVLWVETQNINFPAITFYRSLGFEICGFDTTLYDAPLAAEAAVFLSKPIIRKQAG